MKHQLNDDQLHFIRNVMPKINELKKEFRENNLTLECVWFVGDWVPSPSKAATITKAVLTTVRKLLPF